MIQILKSKFEIQKLTKFLVKNIQLFFDYMKKSVRYTEMFIVAGT